jgi:hypothetical protein
MQKLELDWAGLSKIVRGTTRGDAGDRFRFPLAKEARHEAGTATAAVIPDEEPSRLAQTG